jgi:hypothetical protein
MKRIQILIVLFLGLITLGYGQRFIKTDSINYIEVGRLKMEFMILDSISIRNLDLLSVPKYLPGELQLEKHLTGSLRFPKELLEDTTISLAGFEAEAIASFVIDNHGNVRDIRIVKGFHKSADEEILHTLNSLQKFEPGKYDNTPIEIRLLLKIIYKA